MRGVSDVRFGRDFPRADGDGVVRSEGALDDPPSRDFDLRRYISRRLVVFEAASGGTLWLTSRV